MSGKIRSGNCFEISVSRLCAVIRFKPTASKLFYRSFCNKASVTNQFNSVGRVRIPASSCQSFRMEQLSSHPLVFREVESWERLPKPTEKDVVRFTNGQNKTRHLTTGLNKSREPVRPGNQILYHGASCPWVLSASCPAL